MCFKEICGIDVPNEGNLNIPRLRFPGFEGEWKVKKLEEIGDFKNGINKSSEDFGFGVPFINLMDVFGKPTIVSNQNLSLVNANNKEISLYDLKKGDVLFIRSSVKRSGVGETSVVLEDLSQTVYSGFLIRFRDEKFQLNLNFKKHCFSSSNFRNNLLSLSSTSANTNINQDSLNSLSIYIPCKEEQKKVSDFLSLIDERIITQNKIIGELNVLKTTIAKKIFSQQLRFKDDFPKWEVKKLGNLGVFFSGGTPLTSKKNYFNGDIPFIKSGEINSDRTEQYLSGEGLKNSSAKMVKTGDLIYALYGATSGEVGISKINGAINQAVLCIRTSINNIFLMNYLILQKESIIKTYLQGGQGNLSAEIVKSLKVFVPNIEEQYRIANFLTSIDKKINIETQLLQKLEEQKMYLLQNLFV